MSDSLDNLTTKELRNLALDRGVFGARFMGRASLLRRLRGQRLGVLPYLYLLPVAVVWQLIVVVVLVVTQVVSLLVQIVLLPFKATRWLLARPSKAQPQPAASTPSSPVTEPAIAPAPTVPEPNVSLVLVRVRQVLIREVSIVQVSRSRNDDS